jgi:hypothetical protein
LRHKTRHACHPARHDRVYNRAEHPRQNVKTDHGNSVYDRCYGWREGADRQGRHHDTDKSHP